MAKKARVASDLMEDSSLASALVLRRTICAKNCALYALQQMLRFLHCQEVRKTFQYRLYPTKKQHALLDDQLAEACRLYNAALAERRYAWKMGKTSITYYQQQNQLRDIRAAGDLTLASHMSCQAVLRRVDRTFCAFFRRIKAGKKAGYP
jgi:hypothetical protein